MKECRRCGQFKPRSEFHKSSRLRDGLQTWCKQCINKYKVEWRDKRRTEEERDLRQHILENRELVKQGFKRCSTCGDVKPLSEFWRGEGTGNRQSQCAACMQVVERRAGRKRPARNVEQQRATKAVYDAITRGEVERPTECSVCGRSPKYRNRTRIEFHHTNGYDAEHTYFGAFVCSWCHNAIHRGRIKIEGRDYNPHT